jgi:hypothetical protein
MPRASKRLISLRNVQQFRVSQGGGTATTAGLQIFEDPLFFQYIQYPLGGGFGNIAVTNKI